jgi:transketolase
LKAGETMIILREKLDSKKVYGEVLVKLGEKNPNVVVLEADLMKASGSDPFLAKFPERHFNVGIAEQDLIGTAAGLAAMGKIPFASSFACFASQRACDQAVNSVAYNKFNVKIVGSYAGLTSEKNGGTHISVEDLAIFRSMPNMVVIDPGDGVEFAQALEFAAEYEGPVYIRSNKGNFPTFLEESYRFQLGKAIVLSEGNDIGLITTGITTLEGIKACEGLAVAGIRVRHVHMPSLKPIDAAEIITTAMQTKRLVTVENHSIIGGLGSAVAEVLTEGYPVRLKRMGLNDCFGETAKLDYLMEKFGISASHIVKQVKEFLKQARPG